MGDRGNICIVQHPGHEAAGLIYLYTHWGGYDVPATLQRALKKANTDHYGSLTDEAYLARIIFQEMLGGDDGCTGFGISSYLSDHEYPLLVVDCNQQSVWTADERGKNHMVPLNSWSFTEYIALDFGDKELGGWQLLAPKEYA